MLIRNQETLSVTAVSNRFIDGYMPEASGEFVKIYLYLLRLSGQPDAVPDIASIADRMNHTEADVMRALRYWEKQHLLRIEKTADGVTAIELLPVEERQEEKAETVKAAADVPAESGAGTARVPKQIFVSETSLQRLESDAEFRQLLFVAETYLSRTLSAKDIQLFAYLYDQLEFSEDLLEYLVEYCVSKEHRTTRYMESVALGWHSEGIRTVEQAKETQRAFSRENRQIMQAFGISGRVLTREERRYVEKWLKDYAMTLPVVVEACSRTMAAIHQPSFEYTDKILFSWQQAGVHTVEEAKAHQEQRRSTRRQAAPDKKDPGRSRFQNYRGRDVDLDAMLAQGRIDGTGIPTKVTG